jgi:hypothetical protein
MRQHTRRAAIAAALLAGSLSGCNWIQGITENPNAVPQATADQLLISIQLGQYLWDEGQTSRLSSMWTQQMAGVQRQFTTLSEYVLTEGEGGVYSDTYTGGGLVDIRRAIADVEADNRQVYAGILKVYEAYRMGMLASVFGDVSYTQAVDTFKTPVLDQQADVYAAVQAKLDEAITDLNSGNGAGPGGVDFAFRGDAAKWIAVAHTLKARFYMHWAEVDASNYAKALTETASGVQSATGDWVAHHTSTATETNLWYQFNVARAGYIASGEYLVSALRDRSDPRLEAYFLPATGAYDGEYVGAPPGPRDLQEPVGGSVTYPSDNASALNDGSYTGLSGTHAGAGSATYAQPFVTCAENHFIMAEAQYKTGVAEATVHSTLDDAIDCAAARMDLDLSGEVAIADTATGVNLYNEIMLQKYMASFLNIDAWNDYKRTCQPAITTWNTEAIPARLLYPLVERTTNPNIPDPSQQPARNANDPNACTP